MGYVRETKTHDAAGTSAELGALLLLLPCPFCGNDVNDDEGCFQSSGFRAETMPAWSVRCGNPGCNADVTATTREEVIVQWNRRSPNT